MQKIRLVPIANNMVLITDATTNWHYVELNVREASGYGPLVDGIGAHTLLLSKTTNFEWKIIFFWGINGEHLEPTPVDLFSATSTVGNAIPTPYTDATKMGLVMSYRIAYRSTSAGAQERGVVSGALAFQFKT